MSDIKINQSVWKFLSTATQDAITKRLVANNIIGAGDVIVADEEATDANAPQLGAFQAFRDCGSSCDQEATAIFVACMQSPGTDEKLCGKIAQATFFDCMENCVDDDDDA